MKSEYKRWLLVAILGVGTLLYVVAILWVGFGSIKYVKGMETPLKAAAAEQYPVSAFVSQAILVIGGALATFLGSYLGISITKTWGTIVDEMKSATPEGISGWLALIYFLSLVLAIIFWAITGFSIYAGQPLQDLAYSFLGIFAGALAALSQQ
jgi:hypothetical protein